MIDLKSLLDILTLEKKDTHHFVGQNYKTAWGRVFGGQVLGQSLHAAYQTVPEDRKVHSMHGYFILGGSIDVPIKYEVDIIRDGGSFTTRRVVAFQNEKAIFNMSASFQLKQEGVDHQISMPNVLPPEELMNSHKQIEQFKAVIPDTYKRYKAFLPKIFEFKPVDNMLTKLVKNSPPFDNIWFKTTEKLASNIPLQHQLLAYASDYNILRPASMPHREFLNSKEVFYTSLDHALWFHRDFDISDWLLYAIDSPSASNSRGFSRGSIFDSKGNLIASVAQEGLMRILDQGSKVGTI
jgi:acyl-CoA thioesterase-2